MNVQKCIHRKHESETDHNWFLLHSLTYAVDPSTGSLDKAEVPIESKKDFIYIIHMCVCVCVCVCECVCVCIQVYFAL